MQYHYNDNGITKRRKNAGKTENGGRGSAGNGGGGEGSAGSDTPVFCSPWAGSPGPRTMLLLPLTRSTSSFPCLRSPLLFVRRCFRHPAVSVRHFLWHLPGTGVSFCLGRDRRCAGMAGVCFCLTAGVQRVVCVYGRVYRQRVCSAGTGGWLYGQDMDGIWNRG